LAADFPGIWIKSSVAGLYLFPERTVIRQPFDQDCIIWQQYDLVRSAGLICTAVFHHIQTDTDNQFAILYPERFTDDPFKRMG